MSIPSGDCKCIKCGITKDNIKFPYCKSRLDSYGFYIRNNRTCKKCIAENNKAVREIRKYNPIPELGTPCECCNKPIMEKSNFQLDHDHKDNTFRGYICRKCNIGIGNLGDDEEGLLRALRYILKIKIVKKRFKLTKIMKNGVCIKRTIKRIN